MMNFLLILSQLPKRAYLIVAALFVLSALLAPNARADVACRPGDNGTANSAVALNGSFYAGNDLPVGSVIYNLTMSPERYLGLSCDGNYSGIRFMDGLQSEPMGAPASMYVAGFGTAWVYPTNINGIGVMFWNTSSKGTFSFTATSPAPNGTDLHSGTLVGHVIRLALIKTGPVASGSEVLATSLPQPYAFAEQTSGYTGLPATLWNFTLTGGIHIITQTCQTPDVSVEMGSYEISQYFRKVGSTTPWIDSSILLKNCPTFSGYHNFDSSVDITGSGSPSGNTSQGNVLSIYIAPTTSMLNEASGVIALNNSRGTPAGGVGIQLGYSTNINASPTSPSTIWKNGVLWEVIPPKDGTPNFRIPLAARYYQNNNKVTPGTADSKVIFTISYN